MKKLILLLLGSIIGFLNSFGQDLIVQSPIVTPTSVNIGATITVSCTVKNQGTALANFPSLQYNGLRYYFSTNNSWDSSDKELGSSNINDISAGGTQNVSGKTLTIPTNVTSDGTFYILFYIDKDGDISETNETNNVAAVAISIHVPKPDLIVQSPTETPNPVNVGANVTVSCNVKNQGDATANFPTLQTSGLRYFLSSNTTWDSSDKELGSSNINDLAAGGTQSISGKTLTIPNTITTDGIYYILYYIDKDGDITESNENNNVSASTSFTVHVPKPDLIVQSPTETPNPVNVGANVTVSCNVKNQGDATADFPTLQTSGLRYFLSSNTTWDSSDKELGSSNINDLAAGGTQSISGKTLTIPNTITTDGIYYILYYIDKDGDITESNENNNVSASTSFTVHVPKPDLIVQSPTETPNPVNVGANVTVSCNVKNQGDATANFPTLQTSGLRYFLSSNTTWDSSDKELGSSNINDLAAGGTQSISGKTLTIPTTILTDGTYYILFYIDKDANITESIESNNVAASSSFTVHVPKPDLIVQSPTVNPLTINVGTSADVTCTVKNQGDAAANFQLNELDGLKYFLSLNNTYDASDIPVGTTNINDFAVGESRPISDKITVPTNTTEGTYYLIFFVDPITPDYIQESNEGNNTAVITNVVVRKPAPDLIIQLPTKTPNPVNVGANVTVSCVVKNQGDATADFPITQLSGLKYYLSSNTTWESSDTELGSSNINNIAAGGTQNIPGKMLTIPTNTVSGDYYILFYIDKDANITESNESNNIGNTPIKIVVPTFALSFNIIDNAVNTQFAGGVNLKVYESPTNWNTVLFNQTSQPGAALSWFTAPTGQHPYEISHTTLNEYWGTGTINVTGTAVIEIPRSAPYETGWHLAYKELKTTYSASDTYYGIDESSAAEIGQTTVYIPVEVYNPDNQIRNIKAYVNITQNKSTNNYLPSKSIQLGSKQKNTLVFDYKIPSGLTPNSLFYIDVKIETEYNGQYQVTDISNGWESFMIKPFLQPAFDEKHFYPQNGDINVPLNSPIYIAFNKDMEVATINNLNNFKVSVNGSVMPGTIEYDKITKYAIFTPTTKFSDDVTVNVSLNSFKDVNGNLILGTYNYSFQTNEIKEKVLNVPYYWQGNTWYCWATSFAMWYKYNGNDFEYWKLPQENGEARLDGFEEGSTTRNFIIKHLDLLDNVDLIPGINLLSFKNLIKKRIIDNNPVVYFCNAEYHTIILVGFIDDGISEYIIYHDPHEGSFIKKSWDLFKEEFPYDPLKDILLYRTLPSSLKEGIFSTQLTYDSKYVDNRKYWTDSELDINNDFYTISFKHNELGVVNKIALIPDGIREKGYYYLGNRANLSPVPLGLENNAQKSDILSVKPFVTNSHYRGALWSCKMKLNIYNSNTNSIIETKEKVISLFDKGTLGSVSSPLGFSDIIKNQFGVNNEFLIDLSQAKFTPGLYRIEFEVFKNNNTVADDSYSVIFNLEDSPLPDKENPTVNFSPLSQMWQNGNKLLDVNFFDNIALNNIWYQIDSKDDTNPANWHMLTSDGVNTLPGSQNNSGTSLTTDWKILNTDWNKLSNGMHYQYFKVTDDAGNTYITPDQASAFAFGKDDKVPNVSFNSPTEGQTFTTNTVQATWYADDLMVGLLLSGLDTFYVAIDQSNNFIQLPESARNYTFNNLQDGTHTIYLKAKDKAGNYSGLKQVSFKVAVPLAKTLTVAPDNSWDFGNVAVNSTKDEDFILTNTESTELSVTSLTISGANANQFSIISPTSSSFSIAAGGNKIVTIRFKPTSIGVKDATFTIANNSDNAPNKGISLKGTGTTSAVLSIGTVNGSVGSAVAVPVTATNFIGVTGFQFTIEYDNQKISYVSCTNWSGGIGSAVQINSTTIPGKLTFVYNDAAITLIEGKFFDLNFTVKEGVTGTANIVWSDNPTLREISDAQAAKIPCSYNDGLVQILYLFKISGQISYYNTALSTLSEVSIALLNSNNIQQAIATSDLSGNFIFSDLSNGPYMLNPNPVINKQWNGATSMDITKYKKHIGNLETLTPLQVLSGDVNGSNSLTSIDLTLIKQRIGGIISKFTTPDWQFENPSVTINGADVTQNIRVLCKGDANGSYPTTDLKSQSDMFISVKENLKLVSTSDLVVPFRVSKSISKLSSVTLVFNYPMEYLDVKEINMIANNEDLYYTVIDGIIRVIYSTLNSIDLKENDLLMSIKFGLKNNLSVNLLDTFQLSFTGQGEFGNYDDKVLQGVNLYYPSNLLTTSIADSKIDDIAILPNPAYDFVKITNVENATICFYDITGKMVLSTKSNSQDLTVNVSSLISGLYTIRIIKDNSLIHKKLIINKY